MNEAENLLQQGIEQLEAGQPIEVCVTELAQPEASALRLIAAMRDARFPEEDEEVVAAQRTAVLSAAAAQYEAPTALSQTADTSLIAALLSQWRQKLDWFLSRRELAAGLTLLFLFALLLLAWAGTRQRDTSGETEVVTSAEHETGQEMVAGDTVLDTVVGSDREEDVQRPAAADLETSIGPETATDAGSSAAVGKPEHSAYIPVISNPLVLNPQTASVAVNQGMAEVQGDGGLWTAVGQTDTLAAGQRIRTGPLSRVTLSFFDGSQAYLGPNSELSIDELDAQPPEDGFRTVVLSQWIGESDHHVQFRNDNGSRYQVNTPAGSGIARGTKFQVLVTPGLLVHFVVAEGQVDVTGLNQTVSVTAGELTTIVAGRPPEQPAFHITGAGEVSQTGATWTIAGQTFQTHEHTLIVGNPQIGDLVHVEGHLLPDGTRVADQIVLRHRAVDNRFTLTGEVEETGNTAWIVAGQNILVNAETGVDDDIQSGDKVRVHGIILPGGTLLATEITLFEADVGLPFRFTGLVQNIGDETWTISGHIITIGEETELDENVVVGNVVEVSGWIRDNGVWLAHAIDQIEQESPDFAFTGLVQSVDPWQVAGIPFETRDWTIIEPGIAAGDLVHVRGVILDDGTWVAVAIEAVNDEDANTIVLVGIATSIDPWIVNGLQLVVTGDTAVVGDITVGSLVVAEVQLLADGTWQVLTIRPLRPHFGLGCLILNTVVVSVSPGQINVRHWPTIDLDDTIVIEGEIKPDSVVTVPICTLFDGSTIIVGHIIVIYQPVVIIVPPPPSSGDNRNHNRNHNHNG